MNRQNSIILKSLQHRGHAALGLYFPYNDSLKQIAKNLGAQWTQTHKCWWLPNTKENFSKIFDAYRGKAWVDYSALQKGSKGDPKPNKQHRALKNLVPKEYTDRIERMRYSPSTLRSYTSLFNEFLNFIAPTSVSNFTEEDIRRYQDWLLKTKKVSSSTQNAAINAIKFYLEKVMLGERKTYHIERPNKEKKLPTVISEEEVLQIFGATPHPKHRLAFAMIYSTGMRISELINLRIEDVDLKRRVVNIKGAKGRKDRVTILSNKLIPVIEAYYQNFKPNYWFVEGPGRKQYSSSSVRKSLHRSVKAAGIKKRVTPHTFRHCFATHLHDAGTDIRYIQALLGHSSPKTTAIYTQVSTKNLQNLRNPLDAILEDKQLNVKHLKNNQRK